MSCSARTVLLTEHESAEDRWSPNAAWPGVSLLQRHTRAHPGTEQPLSGASKSPDGPSVSPLCPAGRRAAWCPQITGPVPHALFGERAPATASPVEDQMLISHRSCHPRLVCSAAALHLRRSLSLLWIMRQNRGQTGFEDWRV